MAEDQLLRRNTPVQKKTENFERATSFLGMDQNRRRCPAGGFRRGVEQNPPSPAKSIRSRRCLDDAGPRCSPFGGPGGFSVQIHAGFEFFREKSDQLFKASMMNPMRFVIEQRPVKPRDGDHMDTAFA